MIILLILNSIKVIDKTLKPVQITLSFTSFSTSAFDILVINYDLLYHFSNSGENTNKLPFLADKNPGHMCKQFLNDKNTFPEIQDHFLNSISWVQKYMPVDLE